ncbi:MAG: hypothetical protein QXJ06_00570 [Candidatus Aenigmatarchaeota archaeon]
MNEKNEVNKDLDFNDYLHNSFVDGDKQEAVSTDQEEAKSEENIELTKEVEKEIETKEEEKKEAKTEEENLLEIIEKDLAERLNKKEVNINQIQVTKKEEPLNIKETQEYKDLVEARKRLIDAQLGLNPNLDYDKCLEDYEEKLMKVNQLIATHQVLELERKAIEVKIQKEVEETINRLNQEWGKDTIHPIKWETNSKDELGVVELFNIIVQRNPDVVNQIPNAPPLERAKWIERVVIETFPNYYKKMLSKRLMEEQTKVKSKMKNNLIQSSSYGTSENYSQNDIVSSYLKWLNERG